MFISANIKKVETFRAISDKKWTTRPKSLPRNGWSRILKLNPPSKISTAVFHDCLVSPNKGEACRWLLRLLFLFVVLCSSLLKIFKVRKAFISFVSSIKKKKTGCRSTVLETFHLFYSKPFTKQKRWYYSSKVTINKLFCLTNSHLFKTLIYLTLIYYKNYF